MDISYFTENFQVSKSESNNQSSNQSSYQSNSNESTGVPQALIENHKIDTKDKSYEILESLYNPKHGKHCEHHHGPKKKHTIRSKEKDLILETSGEPECSDIGQALGQDQDQYQYQDQDQDQEQKVEVDIGSQTVEGPNITIDIPASKKTKPKPKPIKNTSKNTSKNTIKNTIKNTTPIIQNQTSNRINTTSINNNLYLLLLALLVFVFIMELLNKNIIRFPIYEN